MSPKITRAILTALILYCVLAVPITQQIPTNNAISLRPNQKLATQANEFQIYHSGTVQTIDIVEYPTLVDALTAVNAGDADLFGQRINASDYGTVSSYPNIVKQWAYDNQAFLLSLNTKYYPLNNEHLRRAIAFAINKTDIAENAMNGLVDRIDYAFPLFNEYSPENSTNATYYNSNIQKAIHELALAGMLDVDGDGVVEAPNGNEVCIPIWYPSDIEGLNETAAIVSNNLFSAGINNTLVMMSFTSLQYEVAHHNLSYGIAFYEQELDQYGFQWAATTFQASFQSVPFQNIANINDGQLSDYAAAYLDQINLDAAMKIGLEALTRIHETCPIVPLFSLRWLSVYSDINFENWPNDTYAGAFSLWSPVTVTPVGSSTKLVVAVLPSYFSDFFKSLNPFYGNTILDPSWVERYYFNPYLLVWDSPIATAPDGSPVPRQATSWEMQFLGIAPDLTNNQSRANFYADPRANWTDGVAMNAEDYRFTYEFYKNNSLTVYSPELGPVKVTGEYLAGLEYNSRDMFLFRKLGALPILPEHVWSGKNATGWNPTVEEQIGSGPYLFSAYTPGSQVQLSINQDYYPEVDTDAPVLRSLTMVPDDPIPSESVVFKVFVDDRSLVDNVTIVYTYHIGSINFTDSQMMIEGPSGFQATIPARVTANSVTWRIEATDIWGNGAVIANGSYSIKSQTTTEGGLLTPVLILGASGIIIVLLLVVIRARGKRK